MQDDPDRWWSDSLHQSFRLLGTPTRALPVFLDSHNRHRDDVLRALPYDAARAGANTAASGVPDAKRYRDPRLVFSSAGLLYEDNETVHVTELGKAVRRWLPVLTPNNAPVIGRHAAYALAACQLRNPLSRSGRNYPEDMRVFPFACIWKAALSLDDRISSDELNRVVFKVGNEDDLGEAIDTIAAYRALEEQDRDPEMLGPQVITRTPINDRIIPWVSLASFGYVLMEDKQGTEYYRIRPQLRRVVAEATQLRRRHLEFDDPSHYVEHISNAACLPKDVR